MAGWRRDALASVNSRSSCGSTLLNVAARWCRLRQCHLVGEFEHVGFGLGLRRGLMSASGVAASRLASMASMSSWLLLTAGSGAGAGRRRGRLRRGSSGLRRRCNRRRRDILHHGRLRGGAPGCAGFSAAAGLASSSAMMRRIDARISSIEGSWTFAGCVISDSTSKPFYTKATKELPVPDMKAGIFIAQARLVPRSSPPAASRAGPAPLKATPNPRP